jgi:hypothetical protein
MKNRSIVVIIGEKEENGFAGSVSWITGKYTKNPYTKQIASWVRNITKPKILVAVGGQVSSLSSFLTSDTLK